MRPPRINLSHLITFYFVAKLKSYREASERLFITQPAVSMQIRAFERQFGIKLFVKKGRELTLTKTGKEIFPLAEELYNSAISCEKFLTDIKNYEEGELKLGVSRTLSLFITKYISIFKERFPGIRIILNEGSTHDIIKGLENFSFDIAIISQYPHSSKIKTRKLSEEEMIFVSSPESPLAQKKDLRVAELDGENFILPGTGSGTRMNILRIFEREHISPYIVAEVDNPQTIKRLVMENKGISLMFPPLLEDELKRRLIVKLPIREKIVIDVELAYNAKPPIPPKIKAFQEILTSSA